MARRGQRTRFIRPAKATKIWLTGVFLDRQTVAANTRVVSLSLDAGGLLLRPFTVLRSRFEILWNTDQAAVTEMPIGALGVGVVNDVAAALGASAVPDPVSDANYDWFVHQGLLCQISIAGTVAGFQVPAGQSYTVDSKSMRKVGIADDIVVVSTNSDASVGAEISLAGRILVQLH